MYKKDLALNNLQWLVCHKTKPNSYLIQIICTQLYNIKYFYRIRIIYTQLYGFKYFYLILIVKTRYYNHKTSFSHEKYRHSTTLSSYVWELKDNKGIEPIMKWEVIKKCRKYRAEDRSCLLCMEEKLAIASCKSRNMLNQRSEVLNSCRHKRAWLLYN